MGFIILCKSPAWPIRELQYNHGNNRSYCRWQLQSHAILSLWFGVIVDNIQRQIRKEWSAKIENWGLHLCVLYIQNTRRKWKNPNHAFGFCWYKEITDSDTDRILLVESLKLLYFRGKISNMEIQANTGNLLHYKVEFLQKDVFLMHILDAHVQE